MALLILAGCEQAANVVGGALPIEEGDQIRFPLKDSKRRPLPYPMQQP